METPERKRRWSIRQALAAVLLCVLLVAIGVWILKGAYGVNHEKAYTRVEPKVSDIVGTYVPDDQLPVVPSTDADHRVPHVVLNADGSAHFVKLPVSRDPSVLSGEETLSGQGTWSLHRIRDYWEIEMSCNKTRWFLNLCNQRPPYLLLDHIYIEGDVRVRFMVRQ
jgi:hypothetical protein